MNTPSVVPDPSFVAKPVLLRAQEDAIAILTLNHPQTRNSLSEAMLTALGAALSAIAEDPGVRVVVLTAHGPAFCSGHDLKELVAHRADADGGQEFYAHITRMCSAVMQQIVRLPQPVIAAIQGIATAAGCQLVATCDLAVASSAAKFATPGVDIGLFCSTPMVALSRNVPSKSAMEMLLTGQSITAEEAHRIGLLNRVVVPGSEAESALALARQIAEKSSLIVKIGKEAFYRQREMGLVEAYEYASNVMVENLLSRDAQEGIWAFFDKRPPSWEDR